MNSLVQELKNLFTGGSVATRLIFLNVGVFILLNLVELIRFLFKLDPFLYCNAPVSVGGAWFAIPSAVSEFIIKPWSLFTYMFLHEDFIHILFNMMVLSFAGKIFLLFLSARQLVSTYILGGLSGAIVFITAFNIFPIFSESVHCSMCLGASASVLAILAAAATYSPEYTIHLLLFGQVKLKWLAIVFFVLDLVTLRHGNAGGHLAHIGGAIWGFVYSSQLKSGRDIAGWMHGLQERLIQLFKRKPKIKVVHRRAEDDENFNARRVENQAKVDSILDKISKSGYDSLSKAEKEFLFSVSKDK